MLQSLFDAFSQAFTTPAANPTVTLLVLSIVSGAFLILVLLVLLVLTPRQRESVTIRRYRRVRPGAGSPAESQLDSGDGTSAEREAGADGEMGLHEADAEGDDDAESAAAASPGAARRRASRFTGLVVCILVVASVASLYWVTGTDSYCARLCHRGGADAQQAAKLDHADCVACHEEPGLSGLVPNVVSRASMAVRTLTSQEHRNGAGSVSSRACLRCHSDILERTESVSKIVVMSHKEPVADGMACTECHARAGHSGRRDYSMSSCITCHGVSEELSDCMLCHLTDPYGAGLTDVTAETTQTMGNGRVVYPVVRVSDVGCDGCHDLEQSCDPCHGTRMPHSSEFVASGHAAAAAFGRKKMCEKCHDPLWCASGCHLSFDGGHGPTWLTAHAKMPSNSGCVCHASRSGRTTPMCLLCHPN